MALGRFGYDRAAVTEIQDSVAALNALKAQSYDMVLCGIYLDSLDGLGIMRALRAWETEQGLPRPAGGALHYGCRQGNRSSDSGRWL